jgi:hypothetical protein
MIIDFHAYKILERSGCGHTLSFGLSAPDQNLRKRIEVQNLNALDAAASEWRAHIEKLALERNEAYRLGITRLASDRSRAFPGFNTFNDAFSEEKINYAAAPFKSWNGENDPVNHPL